MNRPNPNWMFKRKLKNGFIAAIPAISLQAAVFVIAIIVPQDTCETQICVTQLGRALSDFGFALSIATVGYFFNGFFKGDK